MILSKKTKFLFLLFLIILIAGIGLGIRAYVTGGLKSSAVTNLGKIYGWISCKSPCSKQGVVMHIGKEVRQADGSTEIEWLPETKYTDLNGYYAFTNLEIPQRYHISNPIIKSCPANNAGENTGYCSNIQEITQPPAETATLTNYRPNIRKDYSLQYQTGKVKAKIKKIVFSQSGESHSTPLEGAYVVLWSGKYCKTNGYGECLIEFFIGSPQSYNVDVYYDYAAYESGTPTKTFTGDKGILVEACKLKLFTAGIESPYK